MAGSTGLEQSSGNLQKTSENAPSAGGPFKDTASSHFRPVPRHPSQYRLAVQRHGYLTTKWGVAEISPHEDSPRPLRGPDLHPRATSWTGVG